MKERFVLCRYQFFDSDSINVRVLKIEKMSEKCKDANTILGRMASKMINKKFLTLAEVLDALDLPLTKQSFVQGWVYKDPSNPKETEGLKVEMTLEPMSNGGVEVVFYFDQLVNDVRDYIPAAARTFVSGKICKNA